MPVTGWHSPNTAGVEVGSRGIRVRTASPQEECSLLVETSREVTSWARDDFCAGALHTEPEGPPESAMNSVYRGSKGSQKGYRKKNEIFPGGEGEDRHSRQNKAQRQECA